MSKLFYVLNQSFNVFGGAEVDYLCVEAEFYTDLSKFFSAFDLKFSIE